jgi:hypothetical protein
VFSTLLLTLGFGFGAALPLPVVLPLLVVLLLPRYLLAIVRFEFLILWLEVLKLIHVLLNFILQGGHAVLMINLFVLNT